MLEQTANIYVDGSYNPGTKQIGCAIVILKPTKRPHRIAYRKQLKTNFNYGSNIAEMTAVMTAIKTAQSQGVSTLNIYHDWNGLKLFSYPSNIKPRHNSCEFFALYANHIEKARNKTIINFKKVKAHSGNEYNTLVDRMARAGRTL